MSGFGVSGPSREMEAEGLSVNHAGELNGHTLELEGKRGWWGKQKEMRREALSGMTGGIGLPGRKEVVTFAVSGYV